MEIHKHGLGQQTMGGASSASASASASGSVNEKVRFSKFPFTL